MAKKGFNWKGFSIITLIVLLMVLGLFLIIFTVNNKTSLNTVDSDFDFGSNVGDDLNDMSNADNTCNLLFSKETVCTGEIFTSTLKDGSSNDCFILAKATGEDDWKLVYDGKTSATGTWQEQNFINVIGSWSLRGICDKNDNFALDEEDCFTNLELLKVIDCSVPDAETPCVDSDGGQDNQQLILGTCQSDLLSGEDGCKDTYTVKEYYCDAGSCSYGLIPCSDGYQCIGGSCQAPPCESIINPTSQADCDVGVVTGTGFCGYWNINGNAVCSESWLPN